MAGGGFFFHIGFGLLQCFKRFIACRRNVMAFHEFFCKDFRAFQSGSRLVGAEAGKAGFFEEIHRAVSQLIIRTDDNVAHMLGTSKTREQRKIIDINGERDAAVHTVVTGHTVDALYAIIFFQCFDNRMFAAAAAQH